MVLLLKTTGFASLFALLLIYGAAIVLHKNEKAIKKYEAVLDRVHPILLFVIAYWWLPAFFLCFLLTNL